jgi:sterol desaturase/sphingolipid hydroxylase (fatty acid hydroxylase superfamily)
VTDALAYTAINLTWLIAMFAPLERMWPAWQAQAFLRPRWTTDLAFFLGQYLVFGALATWALSWLYAPLLKIESLTSLRAAFSTLPLPIQAISVVMLGDLCSYWGHRAQHKFDILWRFHAVHHSSEHLDWLAAHREHPLDGLYTQAVINLPAVLLHFELSAVMGLIAFRGMWAVFIHSNTRIPLGPLKYIFGAPILHHWHHARDRTTGNYANLGPWLDVLFGTYRCPDDEHEPDAIGLDEPFPQGYLAQLAHPLTPRHEGLHTHIRA